MTEIDIKFRFHRCQSSIRSVKQGICGDIIRRSEPFAFEYAPKSFRNVQMWRIWRQEEKKQSPCFPNRSEVFHEFGPVHFSIVQYEKSILLYPEGNLVKEICHFIGGDTFGRIETLIVVVAVYHTEYIQSERLLRGDKDIFSSELPAIRHISFRAYMAFVSEVKAYKAVVCLSFEFLQLLGLIRIELRRRSAFGTFSYTSISRANAGKKPGMYSRILTGGLLSGFPGFLYAPSVLLKGFANCFFVRAVHYRLAPTSRVCFQTCNPFSLEAFCPVIHVYMFHFRLRVNIF